MKKIIALLIGCSLGVATAMFAQQPPEGQESPAKKGGHAEKAPQGTTETKPKSNAGEMRGGKARASTESNAAQPSTTTSETGPTRGGGKHEHGAKSKTENPTGASAETSAAPGTAGTNATEPTTAGGGKGKHGRNATKNTAAETGASAAPSASAPMETGKKGKHDRGATAGASATAAPSASTSMSPATAPTTTTNASPAAGASATTGTTAATGATGKMTAEQGTVGRSGKKVETQQIQQIKQQHTSFKAQPRPDRAPAVQFNANFRISGAESWQGPRYEVFRSYHPEWHDRGWYHQRYSRVELIAGGWYYWNNNYWYPAWGYEPGAAYYAYDGPIYVGHRAEPPDKVIADVQAELQDMGYYTGEVDGLLGPLTRQAVRDYQADHGLMVTEVIDEPTLDALQLS